MFVETGRAALRVERGGRGSRSLVLLHELGGTLDSFDDVLPGLEREARFLRYDQRGAGLSEKPRARLGLDDHVDDLGRILAATGLPAPWWLAGVAAGAAIAVAFALARPSEVAGLCLCCPALTVAPERRAYLTERADLAAREGMRAIVGPSLDRSYPPHLRADAQRFETYRGRFLANDPIGYGHANRALAESDVAPRLGELRLPCLVLAGRHDLLRPPDEVRGVADRIAGAAFDVVESGHLMPVQAPVELGRRLAAFLRETAASPIAAASSGRIT